MKKVIRDGKVAVLYSPGYGAGWSTWGLPEEFLYDPIIVAMVEAGSQADIEEICKQRYVGEKHYMYFGGAEQLQIQWIRIGTQFRIVEYDGSESIEFTDSIKWITA